MEDDETITTKPSSSVKSLGSNRRRHNQPQLLHKEKLGSSPSSIEEEDGEEKIEKVVEDSSSKEEIIKELKNIQRQNTLTHYLLTASILITLAWQLSEYSLIWKIKQGLKFKNPLNPLQEESKGTSIPSLKIKTITPKYRLLHQPIFPAARSLIYPVSTPAMMTMLMTNQSTTVNVYCYSQQDDIDTTTFQRLDLPFQFQSPL